LRTTAILVDSDINYLKRLVRLIKGNGRICVVGVADSYPHALKLIEELKPDILLSDMQLKGGEGVNLIRQARTLQPSMKSMIVTEDEEQTSLFQALGVGAKGYILKESNAEEMLRYLYQLIDGGSPISPRIARWLVDNFQDKHQTIDGRPLLSKQELEMLRMLAKGCSRDEMASVSEISVNTVATYLKRIYKKLGVNSKNEAVFEAAQLGLISIDRNTRL